MRGGEAERLLRKVVGSARQRIECPNRQIGVTYGPGFGSGGST